MDSGATNRASYDAIADRWDAHRVELSPAEIRVLSWLTSELQPGARILDLGCGTGRPIAAYFANAGFRVHGVDQSPAMLALAQARLPNHEWLCARIEDVELNGAFAAAIAWDSLFHIPRVHHAAIFTRIRGTLPVGGRFALTAGGSEHPAFTDTMFEEPFFYDSHPPASTRTLLVQAGFQIAHEEFLNHPDGGRDKGRITMLAQAT
jgi:cyclopropane fatty-acyl-phospholipid synthase-like methyltransferase